MIQCLNTVCGLRKPVCDGYGVFLMTAFPLVFFSLKGSADSSGEYVKVGFLSQRRCFRPTLVNLFSHTLCGRCFFLSPAAGFCLLLSALWTRAVIQSGWVTERTRGMRSSLVRYFEAVGVAAGNSSSLNLLETEQKARENFQLINL